MRKKLMKLVAILAAVLVGLFAIAFFGLKLYLKIDDNKKLEAPGNAEQYSVENAPVVTDSPLEGKRILFLGSSVTYGSAAQGNSFADYLGQTDGVIVTKEAVSATTLVDEFSILPFLMAGNGDSYVTRLQQVDKNAQFDAVVVQLSTNDATMKKELGEISEGFEPTDFDTKTVTGAMEFIISYAKETWNCPVIFYTGSYYESEEYSAMVTRVLELQKKWGIGVIDLYNDAQLNSIDGETYAFYMYDKIHPTKAGYLNWWLPAIQTYLYHYLSTQ